MANSRANTRFMVQLSLLMAIQVILAATPLGYLPLGFIDITIMHIPALVGAVVLGPGAGAALGGVFGLTSIVVATIKARPTDVVFTPFLSGSLWSVVLSMVPRILCGLLAALVFRALVRMGRSKPLSAGIAAAVGSVTNTVLVLGGIYLLFGQTYADLVEMAYDVLLAGLMAVAATNGVLEAVVAVIVCAALIKPLQRTLR